MALNAVQRAKRNKDRVTNKMSGVFFKKYQVEYFNGNKLNRIIMDILFKFPGTQVEVSVGRRQSELQSPAVGERETKDVA